MPYRDARNTQTPTFSGPRDSYTHALFNIERMTAYLQVLRASRPNHKSKTDDDTSKSYNEGLDIDADDCHHNESHTNEEYYVDNSFIYIMANRTKQKNGLMGYGNGPVEARVAGLTCSVDLLGIVNRSHK
jgi:hypothetical protein